MLKRTFVLFAQNMENFYKLLINIYKDINVNIVNSHKEKC